MKNVFNLFLKFLKIFGDIILSVILFIFYIIFFFPYRIFFKDKKNKNGWLKVEKYELENKNYPF